MTDYKGKKSIPAIFVFLIGLFTLIPNTTSGQYTRMAILILGIAVDLLMYKNTRVEIDVAKIIGLMLGSIFISAFTVLVVEKQVNANSIIHEMVRLSMNIVLLLLLYNRKIKFRYVYTICAITVLSVFIVQIFQSVSPEFTNLIIRKYYTNPDDLAHHLNLALETNKGFFRAGAFLINPNICGCVIILCSPYYFMGLKIQRNYKNISFVMLIVSFLSIVLSGSRTSLIVFVIMGVLYFFDRDMSNKMKIAVLGFTVVVVILLMVMMSQGFSVEKYRSFNLVDALHQSLFEKIGIFVEYIIQSNPLYWLTGSIGGYSSNFQMDAEWGYVISYFGILGLVWYIKILKGIKNINNRKYRFFIRQYQVGVALMGFTETIFLCMPVAPLFILMALTDVEDDYEKV